eukprot:365325-Chlamydomonas_euryale.AAC.6
MEIIKHERGRTGLTGNHSNVACELWRGDDGAIRGCICYGQSPRCGRMTCVGCSGAAGHLTATPLVGARKPSIPSAWAACDWTRNLNSMQGMVVVGRCSSGFSRGGTATTRTCDRSVRSSSRPQAQAHAPAQAQAHDRRRCIAWAGAPSRTAGTAKFLGTCACADSGKARLRRSHLSAAQVTDVAHVAGVPEPDNVAASPLLLPSSQRDDNLTRRSTGTRVLDSEGNGEGRPRRPPPPKPEAVPVLHSSAYLQQMQQSHGDEDTQVSAS